MKPLTYIQQICTTIFVERRLPWRVQRFITLCKINNLRWLVASVKFYLKKPRHRVVVSSVYFGGVGGTEKDIKSLIESMPESQFFVFSENINSDGFIPNTWNYWLNLPLPRKEFDLYFYCAGGGRAKLFDDKAIFNKKVVNTNASRITDIEDRFDHVVIQSENYPDFISQYDKRVLAFPDVISTFPSSRKPVVLPDKYILTIFNPFSKHQKNYDTFINSADYSKYPIVWCYNDKTKVKHDNLPDHPNVIPLKNLSQEELFFVIEHAQAFVSFSTYESFGWALAEAFFANIPIITKKTGFIDYVADNPGIHIWNSNDELFSILNECKLSVPQYNTKLFFDNSYRLIIDKLLNEPERR